MAVTAQMVKELREKTGAGMMDCKTALAENGGDMEQAVDWLRKKGLSKAAKKSGRVAADGLVGVARAGDRAAIVELNSETDFVARNDRFQDLVAGIAEAALATDGSLDAVKTAPLAKSGKTVDAAVTDAVATVGENMTLRRSAVLSGEGGAVATYVHSAVRPDRLGRIGVLVALRSTGDRAELETVGRQIAMHIAAANPLALDVDGLDPAVVERERAVYADQARSDPKMAGKPESVLDKMVEGRLRKFYEESVLLKQAFVVDPDRSIETVLKDAGKKAGAAIAIDGFVAFRLGEGVEKADAPDFAAEVAAMAGGSS